MPIVSAWVMPRGILGILTMPLGLDAEFWRQMGYGIEWMNAVGLWVASLPGAYGRVSLFGTGPLLLATAGFLLIGLLKTPLRWSGAVAVVAAAIWAVSALIASDGRGFAVRGNDGRLAIHHTGDSFAVREWLAADADGRDVHDQSLGQGIACDASGCIGKLAGGGLVAYALTPEAFEEDCRRAALLIASRGDPPADCKATVVDRALWRQRGALMLSRRGADFVIESARPKNFDRPWSPNWSPAPVLRQARAATFGESSQAEIGGRARDATSRQEDIEADE
jgi:competence protein ComEC